MSAALPEVVSDAEVVESFGDLGVLAFTTGRSNGSFGTGTDEPVRDVMARWSALRAVVGGGDARLATAIQVHGDRIIEHEEGWQGWLRGPNADGHISRARGTAMAVTVADCVPVFLAHPSGATAALHSGWRGTAARITSRALERFIALGMPASEVRLHCGPSICGQCYEVSPDVYGQLTGLAVSAPTPVDLRALIADHARQHGVRTISISERCTRCDNDRFYSHRAGDAGRQLGIIFASA
ncbi:peptidoglycan editing factor PgeF [soil metagenome]